MQHSYIIRIKDIIFLKKTKKINKLLKSFTESNLLIKIA